MHNYADDNSLDDFFPSLLQLLGIKHGKWMHNIILFPSQSPKNKKKTETINFLLGDILQHCRATVAALRRLKGHASRRQCICLLRVYRFVLVVQPHGLFR